ncbi:MAG: hypothetical protein KIB00_17565 [Paeniclostridium sordellii]|nr:hypothetical protein [Paeniclostridium sordellii]
MIKCPFCNALNSLGNLEAPQGSDGFMLISIDSKGNNLKFPPDGVLVGLKGCNNCGTVFMGSPVLVGKPIQNGVLKP